MNFSETFIRRPVLTIVVATLILLLGIQGFTGMNVREYPEVDESVVTVTTVYPGASADLMQGFITTPMTMFLVDSGTLVPAKTVPIATKTAAPPTVPR